ncbi:MAG: hypothetical protein LBJ01_00510 [Tannerella sp.]|jgi:hypothetical protein|nr:hypothetical protein [Tannerella sp.]
MLYAVQKETGWTDGYLLWELSWANVQMKLADAPRYVCRKGEKKVFLETEEELKSFLENHA